MALTAQQRSLRARIAALELHAQVDGRTITAPARQKFLQRFEDQVDPDHVLPEAERTRRALAARRAYMARLALKSSRARAARRAVADA